VDQASAAHKMQIYGGVVERQLFFVASLKSEVVFSVHRLHNFGSADATLRLAMRPPRTLLYRLEIKRKEKKTFSKGKKIATKQKLKAVSPTYLIKKCLQTAT
jgi:hypothetical protein